ncbi:hypothetical protein [Carboxylicivirga linearis]|uniref:Holin n=1 Tax=Carboxylicivirga linearis TaxID=1628157 RepID=A0ABS5JW84_9BACT|nr:hypothetical protein [Carboxylicivirga linearis]MBS2099094.1 hypothetical protein [Carboxylicivirga linearis]
METLRLFTLAVIGSLGFMELTDYSVSELVPEESLEPLIKSILSLLAGILTALISRLFRKKVNVKRNKKSQTKN